MAAQRAAELKAAQLKEAEIKMAKARAAELKAAEMKAAQTKTLTPVHLIRPNEPFELLPPPSHETRTPPRNATGGQAARLLGGTATPEPARKANMPPPLPVLPKSEEEPVQARYSGEQFNESCAEPLQPAAAIYVPIEVQKRYEGALAGGKNPPKL